MNKVQQHAKKVKKERRKCMVNNANKQIRMFVNRKVCTQNDYKKKKTGIITDNKYY